jgi:4-carboxymuconolactone decarboxylase
MSTQPKYDGHNSTMFEEGMKVRRAVVGDTYVDRAMQGGSSEFSWPSQQPVTFFYLEQSHVLMNICN